MFNWAFRLATLAAGDQPLSKIDDNFELAAYAPFTDLNATASYAYVTGDAGKRIVRTNAAAMGDTLDTPTGTSGNFPDGWSVVVIANGNSVTLTPSGATINGAASYVISQGGSAEVCTDGTNYYVNDGRSASSSIPSVTRSAKTGAYTIVAGDKGTIIEATANSWTLQFTAAATLTNGFWCYIKNSGAGEITLDPAGGETVDGLGTFILYPNEARLLICTGTTFFTTLLEPGFQIYTANGTWTKPPGISVVGGIPRGAGGGGGGGRGAGAGGVRSGGGSGGGGASNYALIPASILGTTETVTIGAGGTAGSGGATANGTDGAQGGNTTFGTSTTFLIGFGGGGGGGGTNAGAAGGGGGGTGTKGSNAATTTLGGGGSVGSGTSPVADSQTSMIGTFTGGDGSATGAGTTNTGIFKWWGGTGGSGSHSTGGAGSDGKGSMFGGAAGGAGGGLTAGNAESVGGAGGAALASASGGGGTAGAVNGGAGGTGASGSAAKGGAGGGGGGSQDSGTGGVGGIGGIGGGGGGGGGGGTTTGGAGGVGGAGSLFLWWI